MGLDGHVHAVKGRAARAGQCVGVQEPHIGDVLQHRLQLGGNAGAAFMAAGAHGIFKNQVVVLRRDGRRNDDEHVRPGVVAPAFGVQGLFDEPHDAPRDQMGIAAEPLFAVVRAQHDRHGVQRRVAHQDRRDDPQPVHTFCNRVVKHGGAPGQPLLDHAPAVAQQVLQHHRVALIVAVAPVAGRVIAVGVGIAEAEHPAAGHIFIIHKKGSLS